MDWTTSTPRCSLRPHYWGLCLYRCGLPQQMQPESPKHNVDTHLANHCPNRDYTCPHCSFKATFCEVSEHFEVCRYYPLECPNRCGASFERELFEDHIKMCSLQKVQCQFSYAGCEAKFIRDHQKKHMEQNTQKHLALVAAATLRISQTFEQKLEEKDIQTKKALAEQQKVFERKLGEQQKEFITQLEQKDEQIKTLVEQHALNINSLRIELGIPPYQFTVINYQKEKTNGYRNFSPYTYTHPSGYKIRLRVDLNGWAEGRGTHVSVSVCIYNGDYDDNLKFPAKFSVILELLNQHKDQDHYTREILCRQEERVNSGRICGSCTTFIPHADLELNEDEQTQYLKNDCLKFRTLKILQAK